MSRASLALLAAAQVPNPPPPPEAPLVVQVSVEVVQVDAVVTDDKSRQITDLTPADFVIKEGGQEREIAHLSYVRLSAPMAPGATDPSRVSPRRPGSGRAARYSTRDPRCPWPSIPRPDAHRGQRAAGPVVAPARRRLHARGQGG
jgi:hypothetical protein